MKKCFSLFLVILIFSLRVFSQTSDKPELIDEFGQASAEDLEARLGALAFALSNNSKSKADIIIYGGKESPTGFPLRYGVRIKTYLVNRLKIPSERLHITDCGVGNSSNLVKFILIPSDYQPAGMVRHETVCEGIEYLPGLKTTILFDKFWYQLPNEGSDCCVTDTYGDLEKKASLDAFAERLKKYKTQRAVLIFYSYKCVEKELCKYNPSDSTKLAGKTLKRERNYLIKQHKISPSRITAINGGFNGGNYSQESRRLELWLVGKEGELPKPKPDYFPKKKRKSKK